MDNSESLYSDGNELSVSMTKVNLSTRFLVVNDGSMSKIYSFPSYGEQYL